MLKIKYILEAQNIKLTPSPSSEIDGGYLVSQIVANYLGKKLFFPRRVSPLLLSNIANISKILGYPHYGSYPLGRPKPRSTHPAKSSGLGQYFTLGLDSFYTLLCNPRPAKYLIFAEGYDVPRSYLGLIKKIESTIELVAKITNTTPIYLSTNLGEYSESVISWEQFHGIACAVCAYFLSPIMGEVYENTVQMLNSATTNWGSGEHIDSLFSTEYLTVTPYGHDKNRYEKALELSKSPHFDLVLNYIRPCWRNTEKGETEFNCCKCEKCARTYLSLVAATGMTNIPAFPNFATEVLNTIEVHHNAETQISWRAIHTNLLSRFGVGSELVRAVSRFI